MTDVTRLGALRTPDEKLAQAWDVRALLAAPPTALDPRPAFHSPLCPATVDQPDGSCVAASGFYVQAGQERLDEGRVLTTANIDFWATYRRVKAENGDPDNSSPGLWCPQLWNSVKARGWVCPDGVYRTIEAYYGLPTPSSADAFLAVYQATVDQLGPTQLSSSWDGNWFLTDATGFLKAPVVGWVGGHAYSGCGWGTFGGRLYPLAHQTWGAWGHNPYPGHFYIDPRFWEKAGAYPEAWHVTDRKDAPTPGGAVVPANDKTPRLLSVKPGTQFYTIDTNQPLVRLGGTVAARVYSGHSINATQFHCLVSTGGQLQEARLNKADVSVIATSALI